MSKLTKQLRKDWSQIQYGWDQTPQTPKGRFRRFCEIASVIYKLPWKEVANRVQP
jgi:hypothetical protein